MASAETIVSRLQSSALAPLQHISCDDVSGGCGAKFDLVVVSTLFEGKPLLARHREVQTILAEEMKSIHALTIKALTPAQYEAKKAAVPQ